MASWIFSAMGIANCIGRVFFGKLVDAIVSKYGDETVVYVCMAILTLNGLGRYIYTDHIILIRMVCRTPQKMYHYEFLIVKKTTCPVLLIENVCYSPLFKAIF